MSGPRGAVPAAAALLALTAAALVIVFGVIATSGVYGQRVLWFLAVASPLLATSMVLSWLARRGARRLHVARAPGQRRGLLVCALAVSAFQPALAVTGLAVYALLFALHGASLLF